MSRHFQPSSVSARNNPDLGAPWDYIPIVYAYNYATGSGQFAPSESSTAPGWTGTQTSNYVSVLDDQGTKFSVRSNETIEILSGPLTGKMFKPGESSYNKVLANLATLVPGNRAKIEAVLGPAKVAAAIAGSTSLVPSFSSAGAVPTNVLEEAGVPVPFYKKPWFAPAVIVGVSAVVAGAIVFWPRKA